MANDISRCTSRKVAAYDTWDLSGGYTGFRNTTLRLGIKNILNRDPPLSNQIATLQLGYDPTYADPRGRTFYGSVGRVSAFVPHFFDINVTKSRRSSNTHGSSSKGLVGRWYGMVANSGCSAGV